MPAPGSGKHTHLNDCRGLAVAGNPGSYEPGWAASDDGQIAPTDANLSCDSAAETWTTIPGLNENLPANCVNWWESFAFCVWDGGFLPSDSEREYAATGGSQQRQYPWGTSPPGTGNQYAIYGCYYPTGAGTCPSGFPSTFNIAPVGTATLGGGLWGQLDLAGEVGEWVLDWYSDPYVNPCLDCAVLADSTYNLGRDTRGGSYRNDSAYDLTPSLRGGPVNPTKRWDDTGFRCARSP